MPAGAVVGAATVVAGVYQGIESNRTARRGQDTQRDLMSQDLAFRQQMYEDEKAFRDPIRNYLKGLVMAPGSLDYDTNKAQIERQVVDARRGINEELAASGMEGTGLGASRRLGLGLTRAKALSQAWASGMARKRELAAALLGQANPAAAANGVSQARAGLAVVYGDQARQAAAAANAGWGAAAQGLGSILSSYQNGGAFNGAANAEGITDTIPVTGRTPSDSMNGLGFDWTQPGIVQPMGGGMDPVSYDQPETYGSGW